MFFNATVSLFTKFYDFIKKNRTSLSVVNFILGILCAYTESQYFPAAFVKSFSTNLISLFIGSLKFISLPLIFSAIMVGFTGDDVTKTKILVKKVIFYTFFTTAIAALVGLLSYSIFFPESIVFSLESANFTLKPVIEYFINVFPSDIFSPFISKNPLSVAILAFILGISFIKISPLHRVSAQSFFNIVNNMFLELAKIVINWSVVMFWAFGSMIFYEFSQDSETSSMIFRYFVCISTSNLLHAFIIIPLFLLSKKISPLQLFKKVLPVLSFAFFSKSSASTLPLAMTAAKDKLGVSEYVYKTSLPMCTILNMNACAAFILTSVLFVNYMNGMSIDITMMLSMVLISIICAIGNSGVPMGCFFMSSAYLSYSSSDLHIMSMILPFYLILDMLETATNIWSDLSVTVIVDEEMRNGV